tara:strand:- start:81922 stop:82314 length:393 start_codon:yes stop_codon:yes gene_type:complete
MALEKPYKDIPGTTIFDSDMARRGYHVNQFCMSLMKEENRQAFRADEAAYLDKWPVTEPQREALLARDYNALIKLGGNIYYLAKLFSCDGKSFQWAASTMTGMSEEDYRQMMINGGRSPAGNLYTHEQEQ